MCSRAVALSDWFPHEDYCEGLADWMEVTFMRKFRSSRRAGRCRRGAGASPFSVFSFSLPRVSVVNSVWSCGGIGGEGRSERRVRKREGIQR